MSGNSYDSSKLTPERLGWYKKAGYRIIDSRMHSSVEACRWTKARLNGRRNCYKSVYGIQSHRRVQMTPALDFCTFSCQFCWRSFGPDRFRTIRHHEAEDRICPF